LEARAAYQVGPNSRRVPIQIEADRAFFAFVWVEYVQGDPEEYFLPLAFATGEQAIGFSGTIPNLSWRGS